MRRAVLRRLVRRTASRGVLGRRVMAAGFHAGTLAMLRVMSMRGLPRVVRGFGRAVSRMRLVGRGAVLRVAGRRCVGRMPLLVGR